MMRGAIGLAASLLLACAPAAAAARHKEVEGEVPARAAGAITIAWHGDPARGCAAAGVCDFNGTLTYNAGEPQFRVVKASNGRFFPSELVLLSFEQSAVVRVRRDPPGGTPSLCVDSVAAPFLELEPSPLSHGRYGFAFSDAALEATNLSAGRCTGPVTADLRGIFPSAQLDLRLLRRRSAFVNLSGRRPFAAGPFSGEVVSTLGMRLGPLSRFERDDEGDTETVGSEHVHTRLVRVIELDADYRVASFGGTLLADFSGADTPLCVPLDACGTTGTIAYAPMPASGSMSLFATRVLHGDEKPTIRSALADLRAGRLSIEAYVDPKPGTLARVSSTVHRLGDPACADSTQVALPTVDAFGGRRALDFAFGDPDPDGPDQLRTRCAGPGQSEVAGGGWLAVGSLPVRRLGRHTLSLALSRPGKFTAAGYTGTRSGALTMRLVRAGLKIHVVRRRIFR